MSQTETPKAEGAEERTEETRSSVRRVSTATRRKYTPEEKIRIVLEGFRRFMRRGLGLGPMELREADDLSGGPTSGRWNWTGRPPLRPIAPTPVLVSSPTGL